LRKTKHRQVDATHVVKLENFDKNVVADVDCFFDATDVARRDLILRHHSFATRDVFHHRATTHDASDLALEFGANRDLVRK
jgi:hypothetical protein